MRTYLATWLSLACGLVCIGFTGCEPKASTTPNTATTGGDHGHGHEHKAPTSLADALKEVAVHQSAIKEAFANKKPEDAHDSLHEIGHTLEAIASLAVTPASSDADKQSVKKAVDELFECFGAMDDTLHGKTGKSYDEVAERIDAAVASIKGMVKP